MLNMYLCATYGNTYDNDISSSTFAAPVAHRMRFLVSIESESSQQNNNNSLQICLSTQHLSIISAAVCLIQFNSIALTIFLLKYTYGIFGPFANGNLALAPYNTKHLLLVCVSA